jgi:hypothetical protein
MRSSRDRSKDEGNRACPASRHDEAANATNEASGRESQIRSRTSLRTGKTWSIPTSFRPSRLENPHFLQKVATT